MYSLTLTHDERSAIDWIGGRYGHGHDLFVVLWTECRHRPDNADWDSREAINFDIPEHAAWQIGKIGEDCEYRWDCFAPEFSEKLTEFCLNII